MCINNNDVNERLQAILLFIVTIKAFIKIWMFLSTLSNYVSPPSDRKPGGVDV